MGDSYRSAESKLFARFKISLGLFFGTWLIGSLGFWSIGKIYATEGTERALDGFTVLNSLYMSAITITTVGYGETTNFRELLEFPGPQVAEAFTIVFVLCSFLIVMYCSSTIAVALLEGAIGRIWLKRKMEKILQSIENHYIVCGCGSTGSHIVDELLKTGHQVVAIDRMDDEAFDDVLGVREGLFTLSGDATDDDLLQRAGIKRAAGLFSALHDDKDNLFIALTAHQENPSIRIVARATERGTIGKLKVVGANAVISPNQIGGLRMASEMLRPSVVTFLDTMLRQSSANFRFSEVQVLAGDSAGGKSLREINAHGACGLTVVGILDAHGKIHYNPHGETVVNEGDALIVISDKGNLDRLQEHVKTGVK